MAQKNTPKKKGAKRTNRKTNSNANRAVRTRYTVKDSVFRNLFSYPEYQLELYKTLHPEDHTVSVADLRTITLQNILTTSMYNDLGFSVRDTIFILVEAQSTWTVNIIPRSFLYLANTYNEFLERNKHSLYGTKPVAFPKSELYVVYTGDEEVNKSEINLTDEFFDGERCAIDIRVKVITKAQGSDIISQYILFSKLISKAVKENGNSVSNLYKVIQYCKNQNILKEYLESHEQEAIDMIMELYNQEEITKRYIDSEIAEASAIAKAKGKAERTEELKVIYDLLEAKGRTDEFVRAATDNAYAEKLLVEFGV